MESNLARQSARGALYVRIKVGPSLFLSTHSRASPRGSPSNTRGLAPRIPGEPLPATYLIVNTWQPRFAMFVDDSMATAQTV